MAYVTTFKFSKNNVSKHETLLCWNDTDDPLIKTRRMFNNLQFVLSHKGKYTYDNRADYDFTLKIYLNREYNCLQEFRSCNITDCERRALKFIDDLKSVFG